MSFALTVIPPDPTMLNVLSASNVPPPVKPAPAVKFLVSGAFVAIEFVNVVLRLASLPSAVAISFNVSSVAGAPPCKFEIAFVTYSVVATFVLLSAFACVLAVVLAVPVKSTVPVNVFVPPIL